MSGNLRILNKDIYPILFFNCCCLSCDLIKTSSFIFRKVNFTQCNDNLNRFLLSCCVSSTQQVLQNMAHIGQSNHVLLLCVIGMIIFKSLFLNTESLKWLFAFSEFNNKTIKHEYLRFCASRCLSLLSFPVTVTQLWTLSRYSCLCLGSCVHEFFHWLSPVWFKLSLPQSFTLRKNVCGWSHFFCWVSEIKFFL